MDHIQPDRTNSIVFPEPLLFTNLLQLLIFLFLFVAGWIFHGCFLWRVWQFNSISFDNIFKFLGHGIEKVGKVTFILFLSVPPSTVLLTTLIINPILQAKPIVILVWSRIFSYLFIFGFFIVLLWTDGPYQNRISGMSMLIVLMLLFEGLRLYKIKSRLSSRSENIYSLFQSTSVHFTKFFTTILGTRDRIWLPLLLSACSLVLSSIPTFAYLIRHLLRFPELKLTFLISIGFSIVIIFFLLMIHGLFIFGLFTYTVILSGKEFLQPTRALSACRLLFKNIGGAATFALFFMMFGFWSPPRAIFFILLFAVSVANPQFNQLAYSILYNRDVYLTYPFRRNLIKYYTSSLILLVAGIASLVGIGMTCFLKWQSAFTDEIIISVVETVALQAFLCSLIVIVPLFAVAGMIGGSAAELHSTVHGRLSWYANADLGEPEIGFL